MLAATLLGGWTVGACSGPPASQPPTTITAPPPPPAPTPSAATSVSASAIPSASAAASAANDPGDGLPPRRVVVPILATLDSADPKQPHTVTAPCDFQRPYRGGIGTKTRLSIGLTKGSTGSALTGKLHYDVAGRSIEVTGEHRADGSFTLRETGAGTFEGRCDSASGRLSGDYSLKGKTEHFELLPRAATESWLFLDTKTVTGFAPNPPACAQAKDPTVTSSFEVKQPNGSTELVVCFPRDAKDRLSPKEPDAPTGVCSGVAMVPQLFGLGSVDAERLANSALTHDGRPWWTPAIKTELKACRNAFGGGLVSATSSYEIANNDRNVLSILLTATMNNGFRSTYLFPESIVLDLSTGRKLGLNDVVINVDTFAQIAKSCLPFYREFVPAFFPSDDDFQAHFAWKGADAMLKQPLWVVVPGGLALLAVYASKMEEYLSGTGPVVSFAALRREGLLQPKSPIKRLWDGVQPAAAGSPACTTVYMTGGPVNR